MVTKTELNDRIDFLEGELELLKERLRLVEVARAPLPDPKPWTWPQPKPYWEQPGQWNGHISKPDPNQRTYNCPCKPENGGSGICGCILGGTVVTS